MTQKTILIVEDFEDLAESLEDLLKLKNYRTLKALNGTDGLKLAFSEHPDLILLDIRLPDIDGQKILEKIREDDWGKNARILILTASDIIEKNLLDLKITPTDIIYKSHCSIEDITTKIHQALTI